jgi:hypothetical protein
MTKTLLLALALSLSSTLPYAQSQPADPAPKILAGNVKTTDNGITPESRAASILLPHGATDSYRITGTFAFALTLPDKKPAPGIALYIDPPGTGSAKEPGVAFISIVKTDAPPLASALTAWPKITPIQPVDPKAPAPPRIRTSLTYWPGVEKVAQSMVADGLTRTTWANQPIPFQIDVTPGLVTVYLHGRIIGTFPRPTAQAKPKLVLEITPADTLSNVAVTPIDPQSLFIPVNLAPFVNDSLPKPAPTLPGTDPVPFNLSTQLLNLKNAGWIDQQRDPSSYISGYDAGPYAITDDRMTVLSVPKADYVAAHIFASASDAQDLTNTVTLRAGKYGAGTPTQILQKNFTANVPRAKGFTHVVIPMTNSFAQDVMADSLDIEVTKEVKLVRHYPDPSRYQNRPVGPTSGVKIAAITLEKSPLQMTVTSDEPGHAFVLPKTPSFKITLTNITDKPQPYTLTAAFTHLRGEQAAAQTTGTVAPNQTASVQLPLTVPKLGYYDISITLATPDRTLLTRNTSFAQLPQDTRKHRDKAPWGAWDWNGTHFTATDADFVGSLFYKLGYRYGMARYTQEQRAKWGMVAGFEAKADPDLKQIKAYLQEDPNRLKNTLMFHETSVSGAHASRIPDMFTGRPAYIMNEAEQKRFDELFKLAIDTTTIIRKEFPDYHIKLGNGPLALKEELYRHKFPANLFDSGGNEPGAFARPPETQPPDMVASNASMWMDRQLLDHYGYPDKPVRMCYEVGYPGDNPGNLSSQTQANYFVRHVMHAMAASQPFINIGGLTDTGNSYYFSNWGSAAFVRAYPENNIKPAYVALSNMTLALDGATYKRTWNAGTTAVYAMEFSRPDNQNVLVLWTLRGKRNVAVTTSQSAPTGAWTLMDDQGNLTPNVKSVVISDSPVFLFGPGEVTAVRPSAPVYADAPGPKAAIVAPLANLDGWSVVSERNAELEAYNPMNPRKKGSATFVPAADCEGRQNVIRVSYGAPGPAPDTVSNYTELENKAGIPIPGQPKRIGLWVNGNAGWGRIIFEFTDASGQRWTSIGSAAKGDINPWMLDWMPKEMVAQKSLTHVADWNTDDSPGHSRINFDGWRYLSFGLPGQYPGQDKQRLPDNSYWKSDKDGVVHYPLTLRKIIVDLPEKVLHVKTWAPPARPNIYLKDITVSE